MERKYIIYQHTTPSGKVYIGQTCQENPNKRWQNGKGYKPCKLFYNSIKKYGWDNIEHKILHTGLTKEKADILEKMYIQFFKRKNISLNITDGGGDGMLGHHLSEEARRKVSEANKGKLKGPLSEATRRKISEAKKGKLKGPFTDEHRRKLSEANKRKWTSESRRKVSEALKGKRRGPLSVEHRQKISEGNKGKTLSAETKRKMSEARKGKLKKRSIWLNEFSQEIEMDECHAKRYHPNWVKVRDI